MQSSVNKGFTLVELSIVVAVASFLVTGAMLGKNLVDKAELDSVIADVRRFSNAMDQFQEKYGALPGDIRDASGAATLTVLPTATPAAVAGDGNGKIDTSAESLHFWRHLSLAGLLPGNFDGVSTYTLAVDGAVGGVPGSRMKSAGYKVTSSDTLGTYIDFVKYSAAASTLAVLKPRDAYYIDQKMDDGNPITGRVVAVAGSDVAAATCYSGTSYTLTNSTAACTLRFMLSAKAATTTAAVGQCNGSYVGTTRQNGTSSCPVGYVGFMVDSCKSDGTWGTTRNLCKPVTCGSGTIPGDKSTLACPPAQAGNIILTCGTNGVWSFADACSIPASSVGSCSYGETRNVACSLSQTGSTRQSCDISGRWVNGTGSCAAIRCAGAVNLGVAQASATTCTLNSAVYSADPTATRAVTESCTLPLSGTVGVFRVTGSNCLANYGACAGSATRNIGCPPGYAGAHYQKCNGSTYETVSNTCTPVTCGGEPVGAFRVAAGRSCLAGYIGTVLEVCAYTNATLTAATWQTSTVNCSQMKCPELTDGIASDGYATWPETNAGTASVSKTACMGGYYDYQRTYRTCNSDGTWGPIQGGCTLSSTPYVWYDASDPSNTGVALNGNAAVNTWFDKGPSGRNLTPDPTAATYDISTPFKNSRHAIEFTGTQRYTFPAGVQLPSGTAYTWVAVVYKNATNTRNGIMGTQGTVAAHNSLMGFTNTDLGVLAQSVLITTGSTLPIGVKYLMIGRLHTGTGHSLYVRSVNGTQTATNANTTTLTSPVNSYIGYGFDVGPNYFTGHIGEVIVFNRALSAAEQAALEIYLNNKWGIY